MNYFTHSTIILILAIIILLVLLIYTNYLDKSKKIKKQVMLKLDRDEPTQEPSTTVSNNTNHWSDNQLYLHSFSEPLNPHTSVDKKDKTKIHEHPINYFRGKNHISESSSIPTSETVAWAKTQDEANDSDIPVITRSMQPKIRDHIEKHGDHTHYEHPSATAQAITPEEGKSFLSGNSASRSKSKPSTNANNGKTKPAKHTSYTNNVMRSAKKIHCNKMKCTSKEDKLEAIIDHLVTKTLTSDNFKTRDPQKIIDNAKLLLNKQPLPGLINLENNIHTVFYSREIRHYLPEYNGRHTEILCDDYIQQHLIENATRNANASGMITIKNIQTNVDSQVLIEDYISITQQFCVNKILQLVNLVHLFTTFFAIKENRNNIINTLKITLGYVQWVDANVEISGPSGGWGNANPTFMYNFNKIISTINSKQFICDMEDLHKFTTFSGISKINPFSIAGFISTMQKHIQKINNYGIATLLENCSKPDLKNLNAFSIINPNYTKYTLNPDPKIVKQLSETINKLKNIKKSNNMKTTQIQQAGTANESINSLGRSSNYVNGITVNRPTYLHTINDIDLDKMVNIRSNKGKELTYVSIVYIPKFSDQYSYFNYFK